MPGTLFVVATPIGNLDDVTARALRVLRAVSVIAAEDTRRTAQLLARYQIPTPTTSLHEHNEGQKTASLIERLRRGDDIALVSDAGTPTLSDPGGYLIKQASAAGLRIEPVPGPSAVMAALMASGFPAETFTFLGFPPTRSKDRSRWLSELAATGRTVIFFESPHRIERTLRDLAAVIGERPVCVARELTKLHEAWVRGTISEVLSTLGPPRGEYTVVVDIGHNPENTRPSAPDAAELYSEFGVMTKTNGDSRRGAIAALARKYRMSSRQIYAAIEEAKNSGE